MKICVIGTGYVGLVASVCFADVGNTVIGVDNDTKKIEILQSFRSPIYEANMEPLLSRNMKEGRLRFTTDLCAALAEAETCFVCVGTPSDANNQSDLSSVFAIATHIGKVMEQPLTVVMKSTIPSGTTQKVKAIIAEQLDMRGKETSMLSIAYNPEFLKEGDAINDFMKPDRVVVGTESEEIAQQLHELYAPFMMQSDHYIGMSIPSAELTKYASNCMLATRVSFMNELAQLAEKVGANITDIRKSVGMDPRIGPDFLYASLGFGGSCLPKDLKAFKQIGREHGVQLSVIEAADDVNTGQKEWFWQKIKQYYQGNLVSKRVAVWGGAFKANTDDIRHSPALHLIEKLVEHQAKVTVFDPVALDNLKEEYGDAIGYAGGAYECLTEADALVIATEWNEFRNPDFDKVAALMKSPTIFDGRNLYDGAALSRKGFQYMGIGVPAYA